MYIIIGALLIAMEPGLCQRHPFLGLQHEFMTITYPPMACMYANTHVVR
jgi:hypothetical protein